MIRRIETVVALSVLAAAFVGCASENSAELPEPQRQIGDRVEPATDGAGTDGAATDGAGTDGTATDGAGADGAGTDGASGSVGAVVAPPSMEVTDVIAETEADLVPEDEQNNECASSSEGTKLQDVVLAFAFDVSGSMGADEETRALKWEPVIAATKAFFEDQASEGLLATLTFFPSASAGSIGGFGGGGGGGGFGGGGGGGGATCDAASYSTPNVGLTALPSTDFSTAIDGVDPTRNGTPTMPVLEGTIQSVQGMVEAEPNANYVIVLVTDGVPTTCSDEQNDITNVAAVVAGVAAEIPTYVIGVDSPDPSVTGDADADGIGNLNLIAEQGGTGQAFIIDTGDPAKTAADFKAVVEQIRESAFTCNVQIPAPPENQQFDKDKVNVSYTNMLGTTALTYDPDCAEQFGWRYDNADNPTVIEMCEKVCQDIKADIENQGELSVEFGCQTRIGGSR